MKLFITAFFMIILVAVTIGGIYFYMNSKPKALNPAETSPVTSIPVSLSLEVNSPSDDNLSFDSNMLISGKTSPNSRVLISSKSQDLVIGSKDDGSFSTLIDLDEGVNNLQITAFDKNGQEKEVDKTVYYSKEKIQ